ncbi:cellulose biosynthesis cyclic di-GMP-binding regulatory protein BcsB [Pararobbsia silviterrae]|uniref:Cyclic di-GMP-binding protein n=2 Tax=Pararobbsia silviterrae TaxID=1792498 RepID=A0A494XGQ8_9BURK|nr:cellulose biosynthesis cyclic di-GMP-binding regulatory protein BcsB [Pararobbsia silviterrae]
MARRRHRLGARAIACVLAGLGVLSIAQAATPASGNAPDPEQAAPAVRKAATSRVASAPGVPSLSSTPAAILGTDTSTAPLAPPVPPPGDARPFDPNATPLPMFATPVPDGSRLVSDRVPTTRDDANTPSGGRQAVLTFKQLGALDPLQLRGVEGQSGVPFSVRADEVVTAATLHLIYSYSPSLLPDISHLKVIVNGEPAATLPLPKTQGGMLLERDVPVEPRLLTEFNHVNIQLVGHYTKGCEDPASSALWATISNESALHLTFQSLPTRADLAQLPLPFFDRRDVRRLELPIVMPGQPDPGLLEAAGIVASHFGSLAGYRGALFPAFLDQLPPTGNAVVFATASAKPANVDIPPITGPTLSIIDRPGDVRGKLLLVLGRDDAELKTAATVLGIGQATLSGPTAVVTQLDDLKPREPYDAPNWVPSDRPVRFGELAPARDLSVTGYGADAVRVTVRVAPDLFGWHSRGVPIDLRYRYTPRPVADKSSLNISVNNDFVQAIRIPAQTAVGSDLSRWVSRFLPDPSTTARRTVYVPPHLLASQAQLRFHFYYEIPKTGECQGTYVDNVEGAIDPGSTIDLSSYPHYMALPDLAAFSTSGFPFTRMADLSQTAVVLPDHAGALDYSMYFALMGRMGDSTGYPVSGVNVTHAESVDADADKDLIVIGAPANQPLFEKWKSHMPFSRTGQASTFPVSDIAFRLVDWWRGAGHEAHAVKRGDLSLINDNSGALMMGFESPLRSERSVVAIVMSDANTSYDITRALMDPDLVSQIQGGLDVIHGKTITPVSNGEIYYVGQLPPIQYLRWAMSEHPWMLVICGALAAVLLAALMYRTLRGIAIRRLKDDA